MGPGHPKQESHPASLPTKRFHREKMSCSHVRLNKHQHSMLLLHAVSGHQLYSHQATCTGKLFQEVPSAKPQLCVESGAKGRRCLTVRCETGLFLVLEKTNYSSGNDHISHLWENKIILRSRMPQKKCQSSEKCILVGGVRVSFSGSWYHPDIKKPDTLPETNIAPARKPSQKEPIVFQLSIFREGNF